MVAASDASERSSCTSSSTGLPLMPPAALISSAAILIPLTEEIPKFAVVPVVDMKTPIRTLSPPLPCVWQALSKLAVTKEAIRMRFIQILTGLEFLTNLKSEPEPRLFLVFNLAEGRPELLIFCCNRADNSSSHKKAQKAQN